MTTPYYAPTRQGRIIVGITESLVAAYSAAANVPTTLHTLSIPPAGLEAPGDSIIFEYLGSFAASAGSSNLTLTLGGLSFFTADAFTATTGGRYSLRGRLYRQANGLALGSAELLSVDKTARVVAEVAANLDSEQALVLVGEGLTANDVALFCATFDFRGNRV